ncbi:MAG: hypothetical protein HFJ84_02255 [Clostridiales bacterium]|jgi:phage gp45-like|nr:hypothetical protein [Clostridiales bacterium]
MWMARKIIASRPEEGALQLGMVTRAGESRVAVQGEGDYYDLPLAAPWGMACVPPEGSQAMLIPGGPEGGVCFGTVMQADGLNAGEIRLRSAGGAEVLLRNNGDVVVNGQVFAKPREEDA